MLLCPPSGKYAFEVPIVFNIKFTSNFIYKMYIDSIIDSNITEG